MPAQLLALLLGHVSSLALGCGQERLGPIDAQRLALDPQAPLDSAMAACLALDQAELSGSCAVDAMEIRDAMSEEGCARLAPSRWRDECYFVLADRPVQSPELAYSLCEQAGEFAQACRFHRWSSVLMLQVPQHDEDPAVVDLGRQLHDRHAPLASPHDTGFEHGFWLIFWRSWWEAQDSAELSRCDGLATVADQELCRTWAHDAQASQQEHSHRSRHTGRPPAPPEPEDDPRPGRLRGPRSQTRQAD